MCNATKKKFMKKNDLVLWVDGCISWGNSKREFDKHLLFCPEKRIEQKTICLTLSDYNALLQNDLQWI